MDASWTRRAAAFCLLALAISPGAAAQMPAQNTSCAPAGMSGQCNELGSILMDFQREIKGQPIDVSVRITIDNNYREQARYFLFSVRNVTVDEPTPVTLALKSFATSLGPVAVWKQESPGPHEINLWVDGMDIPVGQPIDLAVTVGVGQRGAYNLEALVMPFDRAYHPLIGANGMELSLFAFTWLAVNDPTTAATGSNGVFDPDSVGRALPGMEPAFALAAVFIALFALRARAPPRHARRTMLRLFRRP
jgi:hypothetical protein